MSQRIIEIIGPPGIGKSTIYKSLCKTWTSNANWIYPEALLKASQPGITQLHKWLGYKIQRLVVKKPAKSIPVEYGLRFVDDHKELADFYWNHLSDSRVYSDDEVNQRFRSAYFLFTDFCRYQAILEKKDLKPCVVNEGLLQKSFFVLDDTELMQETINKYLHLLPMPQAIFCINTPNTNIILERLRMRNKVIASHLKKDDTELLNNIEKWQYQIKLIVDIANKRGVKVYPVDGIRSINDNVALIREALNQASYTVTGEPAACL